MRSSPASTHEVESAAELLFPALSDSGLGLFVTADGAGLPHATWMATTAAADFCRLVTLTSPDSRKAKNVEENPGSEWMFSDDGKTKLLYLGGSSEIVRDPEDIRRYWSLMTEKDRAYFLNHYNSGMGFAVLLTLVSSARLVFPQENRKVAVAPEDLWAHRRPCA